MTDTTAVADVPPITAEEGVELALALHRRTVDVLAGLDEVAWRYPTDCVGWDVRCVALHLLAVAEGGAAPRELLRQLAAGRAAGGPLIDAVNAAGIAARAGLDRADILERLDAAGPVAVRRRPALSRRLGWLPVPGDVAGQPERWRLRYLLDRLLTRDTWMHLVDVAGATGADLGATAAVDGRLLADLVADWGGRHGRPFTLHLTGPAGGTYVQGTGGEELELSPEAWARAVSGRRPVEGLLAHHVPF